MPDLSQVKLVRLNTNTDQRGQLTAVEGESDIPFVIHRIFYVYRVEDGTERGGHAHPQTEQMLIGLAGGLTVDVMSPTDSRTFQLRDPAVGLYVPEMIWTRLYDFALTGLCLALASTHYAEGEVIRDWNRYVERVSVRTAG